MLNNQKKYSTGTDLNIGNFNLIGKITSCGDDIMSSSLINYPKTV